MYVCVADRHEEKLRREREEKEAARKAEREAELAAALERKQPHDALMQRIQAAVQDRFDENIRRVFEHWLARTALRSSLLSCWQRWAISSRLFALRAVRRVKLALEPTRAVSGVPVPVKEPWKDMHKPPEKPKSRAPVRRRSSAEPVTLPSIAADGSAPSSGVAASPGATAGGGSGNAGSGGNDDGDGTEEEEEVQRVDPLARVVCDIEVDGGGQMSVSVSRSRVRVHALHPPLALTRAHENSHSYDRFVSAQLEDLQHRKTLMDVVNEQNEEAAKAKAAQDAEENGEAVPGESKGTEAVVVRPPPKNAAERQKRRMSAQAMGEVVTVKAEDMAQGPQFERSKRRGSVLGRKRKDGAVGANELGLLGLKNRRASTFQCVSSDSRSRGCASDLRAAWLTRLCTETKRRRWRRLAKLMVCSPPRRTCCSRRTSLTSKARFAFRQSRRWAPMPHLPTRQL